MSCIYNIIISSYTHIEWIIFFYILCIKIVIITYAYTYKRERLL